MVEKKLTFLSKNILGNTVSIHAFIYVDMHMYKNCAFSFPNKLFLKDSCFIFALFILLAENSSDELDLELLELSINLTIFFFYCDNYCFKMIFCLVLSTVERLGKYIFFYCSNETSYNTKLFLRGRIYWIALFEFHIVLIPLGRIRIQLISLQLWVNSKADWAL